MSAEGNKALVKLIFEQIDKGNLQDVRNLMADEYMLHFAGMDQPQGRDDAIQLIKIFYTSFPDHTHTIEDMITDDNTVAVRLKLQGTHKAEFENIPATGNKISYSGMHFLRTQ
jgi:steroid delta-isomerase-like uncharacterized protein